MSMNGHPYSMHIGYHVMQCYHFESSWNAGTIQRLEEVLIRAKRQWWFQDKDIGTTTRKRMISNLLNLYTSRIIGRFVTAQDVFHTRNINMSFFAFISIERFIKIKQIMHGFC